MTNDCTCAHLRLRRTILDGSMIAPRHTTFATTHMPLAAALRAAALCCKRDQLQLLAIADELEGH